MKEILVLTKDKRLGQLLKIILRGDGRVTVAEGRTDASEYDYVIADIDSVDCPVASLKISPKGAAGAMPCPFRHEELLRRVRAVGKGEKQSLSISEDKRIATLGDKRIALTEVEGRLLYILINAGGFVSRETLLKRVWGQDNDSGIINVYIHYLREKLEKGGEKIIISSRKSGYKIDEKYLGGEIC